MCCGCLKGLSKVVLVATNVAVFLMSGVVLGICLWSLFSGSHLGDLLTSLSGDRSHLLRTAPLALVVAAALVMLLSFLGCSGAWNEQKCQLAVYACALGAFMFFFLSGAIWISVQDVSAEVSKPLNDTLKQYDPDSTSPVDIAIVSGWDGAMEEFKCCGVSSYKDWSAMNPYYSPDSGHGKSVPAACCRNVLANSTADLVSSCVVDPSPFASRPEMDGCVSRAVRMAEENRDAAAYAVLVALLVMAANLLGAVVVVIDCC